MKLTDDVELSWYLQGAKIECPECGGLFRPRADDTPVKHAGCSASSARTKRQKGTGSVSARIGAVGRLVVDVMQAQDLHCLDFDDVLVEDNAIVIWFFEESARTRLVEAMATHPRSYEAATSLLSGETARSFGVAITRGG